MPALIFDGPSLIDGSPIVVSVAGLTKPSTNRKTGPMAQAYILCKDHPPVEAQRNGADHAICGTCPHRNGACYVLTHQGPSSVYKSTGTTVNDPARIGFQSKAWGVRLGAYGDPAAAPTRIWHALTRGFKSFTGYTHQWRSCDPDLKALCMASVDSVAEAREAQALGWRTFRVKDHDAPIDPNEVQCPNQTHGVTCLQCGLCAGTTTAGKNITTNVHGAQWKQIRFLETAA